MVRNNEEYYRNVATIIALVILATITFFMIKPLLLSIALGLILSLIFSPLYKKLNRKIKSKNISAFTICFVFALIIILPIWFLTPIVLEQSFQFYRASQEIDIVTPLKSIFPSIFASEAFSNEIGNVIQTFISRTTRSIVDFFTDLILNFPIIFLHLVVVFFTFFFVLRDSEAIIEYVRSLLPFSKEVEKRLFDNSKGITNSVLYGQVIGGVLQGIILAISFFITQVPNALFLSLIALVVSILPVIGPVLVWVPVAFFLISAGNTFSASIVILFGLVASSIDNIIRPMITSQATRIPTSIVLIGMVGGLLMFGILGLILGPLVLAYFLIILEAFRDKKSPEVFVSYQA